ncbi:hypothetical protein [Nocardia bovistercoris]|uniref:Lipoprotein LppI n=1 Tax=Nocardia bovistercoris TaxID=2785916 RepID=A0A931I7Q9_9NOCA|nr:hypothetical protein [Nocardia bovistercoris]MBH0775621.1 hypothetical protein [Nocardia bovistercoris]
MRIPALAALVLLTCLTAACSSAPDHTSHEAPTSTAAVVGAATTSAAAAVKPAPGNSAALGEVSSWVDSGTQVDSAKFASASTEDGTSSTLVDGDRAFSSPTGKIKCITDGHEGRHSLVCLVDLKNPPAKPSGPQGNWVGGWVEYEGQVLTVGGLHGDPGPFVRGYGEQLAYGSRITVHGTKCRMDSAGLFCVNSQAGTGFRASDAGIVPFGCLSEEATPREVNAGEYYTC